MKKIFRKFGKTAANYNWYFIFSEKNFDATVLFQMDFEPSPEAARRAEAKRDARDRMINKKIAELFVKTKGEKPAFESLEWTMRNTSLTCAFAARVQKPRLSKNNSRLMFSNKTT